MKVVRCLGLLIACVGPLGVAGAAPATPGGPFKIVPAHARVGPRESAHLQVVPPGRAGAVEQVGWKVDGRGEVREGFYRAPYIIAAPGERTRVIAYWGPKTDVDSAEAMVELTAGVFPGAQDCLGAGQQWEPSGCTLGYVHVDELPEVLTRAPPQYPSSVRARNLQGWLIVNAIVCRTGRVLDATALWGRGVTPIPELEDLAIEAAKQWVFKPALVQGQPVATVVAIPFRFPPP